MSDDARFGILAEMRFKHMKAHIRLHLTRLLDYASVHSEIESFLAAPKDKM